VGADQPTAAAAGEAPVVSGGIAGCGGSFGMASADAATIGSMVIIGGKT
jgi:hypothetical protein